MDLAAWLRGLGLERYAQAFQENEVSTEILPKLTADDLKDLGVTAVGHRRKLLEAIAALAESVSALQAEPSPPAEAVLGANSAEAERRQLTVMCVDLVGSTELSARLDPEDMREVIRAYQDTCSGEITRFEGFVAKFMGDGVLAYFGYPRAHEDEAERAARAGLALVESVQKLVTPAGEPLAARIGIATGRVVVGDLVGEGASQEKAVVGETPNLAARLQGLAEPGGVVAAESTRRLLGGLFEYAEMGIHSLKGFAGPVRAWRVVGESRAESRFEALHGQHLTPLVGRRPELAILMERWEWAREGEGQVVLLSGEPGIGKSRIVRALRERLAGERYTPLSHFCWPYHTNSALHPVIAHLKRAAGLAPEDSPEARLAKLETLLGQASERLDEAVPLLGALLGLPTVGRYPPLNYSPQRQKQRTLEILVDQIEGLARRRPVLAVYEDLQWVDPSTRELLDLLVERVRHMSVLVVMSFRPEFRPPWTGQAHVATLALNRLGRPHGAAMVERITGGKPLPAEVLDQIVAKTEGVPLFVEELTKTVLESRLLTDVGDRYELAGPLPSLAIPATVQDSLMARLDRFASVKEVAQIGAAIGREFSHELLGAVAPLGDHQLQHAVAQLVESELVFRRGTPPTATYVFKHALVQDTAYQSLLRSRRQELHARIANALEERFEEGTRSEPEVLARHYREAGMPEKAIPYAIQAGDMASGGFAFVEARARYQEALNMAQALPPSEPASRFQIRAILKLANVASNHEQFKSDLANLEHALTLAEELSHQPRLGQIYYWMARIHYVLGRFDRAVELAEIALRITEELADDRATAAPVNLLARLYHARGSPQLANPLAARSVRQMHVLGDAVEEAGISGILGLTCAILGQLPNAEDAIRHGIEIAERIEHRPSLAACVFYRGAVRGWWRDLEGSLPSFEQALTISTELEDVFRVYSIHGWRGQAYLLAEDYGLAENDLRQCLVLAEQIGTTYCVGSFKAYLAEARLHTGAVAEATDLCRQAVRVATETHQLWSLGIASRAFAQCLLAADPPDVRGAEDVIREALATQQEHGARIELAWSLAVSGQVLRRRGDEAKAKAAFNRAAAMFEDMGMTRDLAKARAALGELKR